MSADGTGEGQAGPPPAIPLTRQVSAPAGSGEWALQEQSKSRRARVSFMSNDVASSVSLPPSPDTPSHLLFVQQHEVDCNKLEARREGYTFGKNGHRAQERRRTADHAHHAQAQAHAQTSAHAHAQTQAQLRMAQLHEDDLRKSERAALEAALEATDAKKADAVVITHPREADVFILEPGYSQRRTSKQGGRWGQPAPQEATREARKP